MLIWQLGRGRAGCYNQRHESEVMQMTTLTGHFDGKVIVPNEPVDLPQGENLIIHIERSSTKSDPEFGTLDYVRSRIKSKISDEDAELMRNAIEEAFENISPDPDVKFE